MKYFLGILFAISICIAKGQKLENIDLTNLKNEVYASVQQQEYEKALQLIDQVYTYDSIYDEMLDMKLSIMLEAEKYNELISFCSSQIDKTDSNYDFLLYLGLAYLRSEKYDEAIQTFIQLSDEYPGNYLAFYNLGVSYELSNHTQEAIKAYERSIIMNPYYARPHYRLGNLCYNEGKIAQAMLCWDTYLIINPTSNDALDALIQLNNAVASKNTTEKKNISISTDDELFDEIDLIINNYAALNKNYKVDNEFTDPYVKQNHVLLSKINEIEPGNGLWSEKYIPMFKAIMANGYFNDFIYRISQPTQNEKYQKILKKNSGGQDKFVEWYATQWAATIGNNNSAFWDSTVATFSYFNSGELRYIGDIDQEGNLTSKFISFRQDGSVSTTGNFSNGKRNGSWTWYFENGNTDDRLTYVDGLIQGPYKSFYPNGTPNKIATYKDDYYNGDYYQYNSVGTLSLKTTYAEGYMDGIKNTYYITGEPNLQYEIPITKNQYNGLAKEYFMTGELATEKEFTDGNGQGFEKQYYRNGKLKSLYLYNNGLIDGKIEEYYSNGNKSTEGYFTNDQRSGSWVDYYESGNVKSTYEYNTDGALCNSLKEYTPDHKLWYEFTYANNKVLSVTSYNLNDSVLGHSERINDKFPYKLFSPLGNLYIEGSYNEDDRKDGRWNYYSFYGNLISTIEYNNGTIDNSDKEYYANGNLSSETPYINGLRNGYTYNLYADGTIQKECYYFNDTLQRWLVSYYPNGTIENKTFYLNNQQIGEVFDYDCFGKIYSIGTIKDGYVEKTVYYDTIGNPIDTINYFTDSVYVSYYDNGNVKIKKHFTNGYINGKFESYYYNGQIHTEGNYVFGNMNGKWSWYNNNGSIYSVEYYDQGEKTGKHTNYHENGKISSTCNYVNGKAEGAEIRYNENGEKSYESNLVNGKLNGPCYFYSNTGELELIRYYWYDNLMGYSYPGTDGKPLPMIPIKNGTAKITCYTHDGKKAREFEFLHGEFNGEYLRYYKNGQIKESDFYVAGKHQGESKEFFENGTVKETGFYLNDERHGEFITYFENGQIKTKSYYVNGAITGQSLEYDNTGNLIKDIEYYSNDTYKVNKF